MTTPLPTPEEQKALDRLCMVKKYAAAIAELEAKVTALELHYFGKANFNPSQPRVPSGSSDGGQWTDGSGSGGPDGSRYAGTPSNPYPRDRTDFISLEAMAALAVLASRLGPNAGAVISTIQGAGRLLGDRASTARNAEEPSLTESAPENNPSVDTRWSLGSHKSPTRWGNQMKSRSWTDKEITDTIKTGKQFEAPNNVNKGNPAIRYENPQTGKFIVRDEKTKQILQISKPGKFEPLRIEIPGKKAVTHFHRY